jgi:L-lactate dehydrogenase complex protein LldE
MGASTTRHVYHRSRLRPIENRSSAAVRAALFITCLADTLFPQVGRATVALLERLGVEVTFPREQTCCGQLHANAGYRREAEALARRFGEVFAGADVIVTPSGSCAGHVRAHVPGLAPAAAEVAARTVELSELLVGGLGVEEVGSSWQGTITYHPTCHSLRLLRVGDGPERLLRAVTGADVLPLDAATECCGFGGTFAVKNAAVSTRMLEDKIASIEASGAGAVCACDSSCLMHIQGGLERRGSPVRAVHLAEVLAT